MSLYKQPTRYYGLAAALGGALYLVLFLISEQDSSDALAPLWRWGLLAPLLLAPGVAALWRRGSDGIGRFGLAIAGISAITMSLGLLIMAWLEADSGWPVWFFSMLAHAVGMTLYGVGEWRRRGLSRWSSAGLAMGAGLAAGLVLLSLERVLAGADTVGFFIFLASLCGGWIVLGLLLAGTARVSSAVAALLLLWLVGCGGDSAAVSFSQPQNGATVSSPVAVRMAAERFTVEPAAAGVNPNAGHLHIMIDVPCVTAGQTIPSDDNHHHFGDGSLTAELALAPGRHTLCLQAADGTHTALDGLSDTITITVE